MVLEEVKAAVSLAPLGTVFGIQFAAEFQSPALGLICHDALPAKRVLRDEKSNRAATRSNRRDRSREAENGAARIDGTMFVMFIIWFSLVTFR